MLCQCSEKKCTANKRKPEVKTNILAITKSNENKIPQLCFEEQRACIFFQQNVCEWQMTGQLNHSSGIL